jgi:hypothetical protein
MQLSTIRTVEPTDLGGRWVIRSTPGGTVLATERTQKAAVEAARADLASNGGGTVVVHGVDGSVKRRFSVPSASPPAQNRDPIDPAGAVDAIGAAAARLQGRAFDRDGDGEADGEESLDGVLDLGPAGPAKTAITQARQWLKWSLWAMALFPVIPAWFMSPELLGAGFVGIFLGTLAWSLGVALITFALVAHRGWSWIWLAGLGVFAFWLSNAIAGAVGGAVLNAASPVPTAFPSGVIPWIGELLFAAGEMYGWGGVLVATLLGGLVGWRAAELVRASSGGGS